MGGWEIDDWIRRVRHIYFRRFSVFFFSLYFVAHKSPAGSFRERYEGTRRYTVVFPPFALKSHFRAVNLCLWNIKYKGTTPLFVDCSLSCTKAVISALVQLYSVLRYSLLVLKPLDFSFVYKNKISCKRKIVHFQEFWSRRIAYLKHTDVVLVTFNGFEFFFTRNNFHTRFRHNM